MNDRNLRLQVIMSAVDKLTRPFKQARASTQELASAVKKSRDALKQIDQTSGKLDGFRKLQAENQKLGDRLNYSRQRMAMLSAELGQMGPPTQRQIVALEKQRLAVQRLEERQGRLQSQTARVRAELYRAGISATDGASATARITRETEKYNRQLVEQEARLKRAAEQQRRMSAAKEQYGKTLEIRDRVAGAGAAMTAAGVGAGAPVVSAVTDYAGFEDAMKGVAKQVNGLRDDNGNRTARFYEMQQAIKNASEQLPMQNGAVDYAALVEGGARMGIGGDAKTWDEQKKQLLNFASVSAKAATAFELPADELAENLGKIAQLYKVPINNIEQLGDVINYLDDNAMSKGADIIEVLQRMGDSADKLDYRKAAALGSTFLSLGSTPDVAASSARAMVRELSNASIGGKQFQAAMSTLKLDPLKLQKSMVKDSMGTILQVLEQAKKFPAYMQTTLMTQLFGKEFGPAAAKLSGNLPELRRQIELTQGVAAKGSMQKESDINKDSLSAQWMLLKAGMQNVMSGLGETLRAPLLDIMYRVQSVTGAMRRWVEQNPVLAGTIMKLVAGMAALTVILGTVLIGFAAVIGPIAAVRFGLTMLGVKTLPSVAASVSRTGSALSWLATAPLTLLRRGMASSGSSAALLASPLDSLRRSAGLAGNALKSVAGLPLAIFRSGMGGIRNIIGAVMNPLALLRGGLSAVGSVIRFVVSGPLALLRAALYGISVLLGALLSPVGLVVTALASVALVFWKYWQPISAFLGGVVAGFQAAAGPIASAFEPLRPVFDWISNTVKSLFGWFTDLLTPVKSTKEELASAAEMGKRFGQALADGLAMVMSPLDTLKSGVSWLLEKLGLVSEKAAAAKLPEDVAKNAPTMTKQGVQLPPGGFPMMYGGYAGYPGFAGFHDNGGYIPRGQFGVVGENGPEIVNGPANITSRRQTAALAAATGMLLGSLATPVAARPMHPLSLPVDSYQRTGPSIVSTVNHTGAPSSAHYEIHVHQAAGQSAQDTVAEVIRQLDARERQKLSRQRSSFYDQGGTDS
ncbi:phage tail tape measure protein [Leclercia adecarboxylata]|uniref:phage tail tape measure protein n=1 Tax=Leclercia adecarboxylata TaxID=83655 RepID=UPI0030199E91